MSTVGQRSPEAATSRWRAGSLSGLLLALSVLVAAWWLPVASAAAEPPLEMGIFPRRHATLTNELHAPLADYLSRELGREVRLVTARDFDAFWAGVEQAQFDIVHYNQFHYVRSSDRYRVIAHNKEFGSGVVAGAIYVRKDSGITNLAQLRGRTIVFGGGRDAMMSYILPSYLLLQAGLQPDDYEAVFSRNPPNSLIALYYKQVDASGAGDILIDLPVVREAIDPDTLMHLSVTEPVLHLPWAVRNDMPESLSRRIQALLVGLETHEEGRAILKRAQMTGFGAAEDADYDPHRRIIEQVVPAAEAPR
ncbi:MAG TPA: phosphate/phosphite/phosphonate ABC transporter substrate-binding protein [Rhodocyclaceae bacterium]|nr:phosphate/phosphite/phosphonate ABC transporter substrate-binding protein [Rhodocyclaceae bacterium]